MFRKKTKPGHPQFGTPDVALARTLGRHMAQVNPTIVIRYNPHQAKVITELERMKIPYEIVMPEAPPKKRVRIRKAVTEIRLRSVK